jgi:porin
VCDPVWQASYVNRRRLTHLTPLHLPNRYMSNRPRDNCELSRHKAEEAPGKPLVQNDRHLPMIRNLLTTFALSALAFKAAAAPLQFSSPFTATSQSAKTTENATAAPEGLTNNPDALFNRDLLLGDLGGLRNALIDDGVAITPVLQTEVFSAAGGGHGGVDADGLLDVAFDFDLERITRIWQDAAFHFNVLDIFGPSLTNRHVGDISGVSNLAGTNTFRLQEIWLQQQLWRKRISLRVGMLAADSEYFTSQAASLFLDGTFGAFTLVALNFDDAPVYPVAAPAVRLDFMPVSFFDLRMAVFAPNQSAANNTHGTDFDINSHDGALVAVEASYLVNQSPNDLGRVGTYKVGTFIQQGDYASFGSQAANALNSARSLHNGTNIVVYGVADQELYKNGQYTIEAFARGGFGTPNYSVVHDYFDAGFNFIGLVPVRPLDIAGLAIGRSGISRQYSDSQVAQGFPGLSSETVIEATYKIHIANWASIQPDFQYFINPSAVRGSSNAFVSGIRSSISF